MKQKNNLKLAKEWFKIGEERCVEIAKRFINFIKTLI